MLLLMVSVGALPETLPKQHRSRFAPRPLVKTLHAVFGDRRFLLLAFARALNFGGQFLYISSAPTIVLTLDRFPAMRGAAASAQGSVMLGFNAFVSGVISPLVSRGFVPLVLTALALNLSAFAMWRLYRRITPDVVTTLA